MSDWFGQLQKLPNSRVVVSHRPSTPRYDRAASKRTYIIREGRYLGVRAAESSPEIAIEIAVWAPNPLGRDAGFYACFRLYHRAGVVGLAQLFTFYDGTEKSVAIKSFESAFAFASSHGFKLHRHDPS